MRPLRILWLSHFVPYPPKGGCFQRSYNLIRRVGADHELHLVAMRHKGTTHPEHAVRDAREQLARHCRSVHIVDIAAATTPGGMLRKAVGGLLRALPLNVTIYESAEMRALVRRLSAATAFDVVHFDTIGLAQYAGDTGDAPRIMTHHGAESHMIHRRIAHEPNPAKKAYFYYEWLALARYERRQCGAFPINVTMSDDDAALLRQVAPDARYVTVANGVDVEVFTPVPARGHHRVVFAGRLDQYSNRDGVLHFMRSAWPLVTARHPDASIDLIGMNPPEELRRFGPNVRVHGFVDDIRPYFADATVAICPVRNGGGTRIKVLDALAMGMPLVSTSIGCEGIDVVPERDLLIGDTPEAFAAQIGRVFDDAPLRQRLAASARRLAVARYSWDALAAQLVENYRRVIGRDDDDGSAELPEPASGLAGAR